MSSTLASSSTIVHTAQQLVYAVTNVYNLFSFKLTLDESKYKLWCRFFQDVCMGAKVLIHITGKSKQTSEEDEDMSLLTHESSHSSIPLVTRTSSKLSKMIIVPPRTYGTILMNFFLNNKMSRILKLQD